jgi:hypothetical protein
MRVPTAWNEVVGASKSCSSGSQQEVSSNTDPAGSSIEPTGNAVQASHGSICANSGITQECHQRHQAHDVSVLPLLSSITLDYIMRCHTCNWYPPNSTHNGGWCMCVRYGNPEQTSIVGSGTGRKRIRGVQAEVCSPHSACPDVQVAIVTYDTMHAYMFVCEMTSIMFHPFLCRPQKYQDTQFLCISHICLKMGWIDIPRLVTRGCISAHSS